MRVGHELGRSAATQLLQPLLRALCGRLHTILARVPALTIEEHKARQGGYGGRVAGGGDSGLPELLCRSFEQALAGRTNVLIADAQVRAWCCEP